jgi:hypothetical protein
MPERVTSESTQERVMPGRTGVDFSNFEGETEENRDREEKRRELRIEGLRGHAKWGGQDAFGPPEMKTKPGRWR